MVYRNIFSYWRHLWRREQTRWHPVPTGICEYSFIERKKTLGLRIFILLGKFSLYLRVNEWTNKSEKVRQLTCSFTYLQLTLKFITSSCKVWLNRSIYHQTSFGWRSRSYHKNCSLRVQHKHEVYYNEKNLSFLQWIMRLLYHYLRIKSIPHRYWMIRKRTEILFIENFIWFFTSLSSIFAEKLCNIFFTFHILYKKWVKIPHISFLTFLEEFGSQP